MSNFDGMKVEGITYGARKHHDRARGTYKTIQLLARAK